ncbi:Hint domain-containing protein [Palleronia caenipelagi]|nr:Hint domain-containing protein [Palleronia caenipelagi]
MAISIVDPNSTEPEHLASVDVKFSGAHLGGGIYFSANHNPKDGTETKVAVPQSSLTGEAEAHNAIGYDYTLPDGGAPWDAYRDDTDLDGTVDFVKAGYDMVLFTGDRLTSTGAFYDGPSIPLLIANDQNDLAGLTVTVTGYPAAANSLDGQDGTLHETTGTLLSYTEQNVGGDIGGYYTVNGAEVLGGMSGGGNFIDYDADGDGTAETYLIGATSRAYDPIGPAQFIESTAFAPHYSDMATLLESLTGTDARTADDMARMTLLSAQTLGSSLTTVQGEFFHENIFGGINDDILLGAGGDDSIVGGGGDDSIDGGTGQDTITGGDGADTLSGGAGADLFLGAGLNDGATDVVTDFEAGLDTIDLSAFFLTFDELIAATTDLGDGSIRIDIPPGLGGGAVQMLNTSINDLSTSNTNVVCFVAGTHVSTPTGEKVIEDLEPGDLITTRAGGAKPLRSLGVRHLGPVELAARPNLWPVEITAGALGPGIPARTLRVSPQHRILVDSKITQRMVGGPALVAARKLIDLPGIRIAQPDAGCTYIHLIFAGHEIVRSEGCWSESFFPGPQTQYSLPAAQLSEYQTLFGDAPRPAEPIVEGKRARRLVTRHAQNKRALQSA